MEPCDLNTHWACPFSLLLRSSQCMLSFGPTSLPLGVYPKGMIKHVYTTYLQSRFPDIVCGSKQLRTTSLANDGALGIYEGLPFSWILYSHETHCGFGYFLA